MTVCSIRDFYTQINEHTEFRNHYISIIIPFKWCAQGQAALQANESYEKPAALCWLHGICAVHLWIYCSHNLNGIVDVSSKANLSRSNRWLGSLLHYHCFSPSHRLVAVHAFRSARPTAAHRNVHIINPFSCHSPSNLYKHLIDIHLLWFRMINASCCGHLPLPQPHSDCC